MRKNLRGALFALLLLLAVTWCVADGLLGFLSPAAETVSLPDLVGRDEHAAADHPFLDVTSVYRYDDSPAGTVLAQEPPAGSLRKLTGETIPIRLTVSLGRERVEIPDLGGRDARDAVLSLRALGLTVEEVRLPGGTPGTVDRTEPAAGETTEVGAVIRLFVRAGDSVRTVAVPALVGLSRGEALLTLYRAGLALGGEIREPDASGSGSLTVTAQSPAAGSVVLPGSAVRLVFGNP